MVAVALMWSTAGVVTRHLEFARSFEVTFWRALFTAMSLLLILPWFHVPLSIAQFRAAGRLFWLSATCWSVMFTAFMVALTLTSVGNVLVVMGLGPLLTAMLARVSIGHHTPTRAWLAMVLAACGIAYMFYAQIGHGTIAGTLVALCVPMASAVNWTATQEANARGQTVDMVPAVLAGACMSAAMTLPMAWPLQANAHDMGLLALLGLGQLAVPCALSVHCARVLKAPEVSLLALLEIIFGIALAWIGAGEEPTQPVLFGAVLVVGALTVNELIGWKERV